MTCLSLHLLVKRGHFSRSLRVGSYLSNGILAAKVEEVDEVRNADDLSYCPYNYVELDHYNND